MKEVFVIRNQHGQFLGKQAQWIDESEPAAAWRTPHRDVALNHLIETNARDIEQRLLLLQCPLNEKDVPLLGDAIEPRKSAPVTYDEPEGEAASAPEAGEEPEHDETADETAVAENDVVEPQAVAGDYAG